MHDFYDDKWLSAEGCDPPPLMRDKFLFSEPPPRTKGQVQVGFKVNNSRIVFLSCVGSLSIDLFLNCPPRAGKIRGVQCERASCIIHHRSGRVSNLWDRAVFGWQE